MNQIPVEKLIMIIGEQTIQISFLREECERLNQELREPKEPKETKQ